MPFQFFTTVVWNELLFWEYTPVIVASALK